METRDIVIKVRIKPSTYDRVKAISVREARTITQIVQLAVEETADRGYTDKVVVKGKI
jgi:hypothetical protein